MDTDLVNLRHQCKRKAADPQFDDSTFHAQQSSLQTCTNLASGSCSCCPCSQGCHESKRMANTFVDLDSFPVGYRFCPTDQELVSHYLLKKIKGESVPRNKFGDINIYGDHPATIVENHPPAKEGEWYFFTPRNRKYVNGTRPNRKAGSGYWKATGRDKAILDDNGTKIGAKKSLVYHLGRPPNGSKTEWIMHEYVVEGHKRERLHKLDMKLDDYVLCKIYKKGAEIGNANGGNGVEGEENIETGDSNGGPDGSSGVSTYQDIDNGGDHSLEYVVEAELGIPLYHFDNVYLDFDYI